MKRDRTFSTHLSYPKRFKTPNYDVPSILQPFLHRLVTVKTSEGHVVEGCLWRVAPNNEHYQPIGNLIFSNKTLVRGNYVEAICVDRREKL